MFSILNLNFVEDSLYLLPLCAKYIYYRLIVELSKNVDIGYKFYFFYSRFDNNIENAQNPLCVRGIAAII